MKKIIFTLLLLLNSLHALEWFSYEKALEKAAKEDKVVMVMLARESCGVCGYMKSHVFNDENVIKELDARFIAVAIELGIDDVPNGLTFVGTPTFHFLDKNKKALSRIDGGKTVPSFLKALAQIK